MERQTDASVAFIIKINLQRLLFLLSFLTYGVGDAITSVYMMDKTGVMGEANPIVQLMYIFNGGQGVIIIKMWFAFMILLFVWLVSRKGDAYWTVNGFLFALFIGGTMAIRANLMAADGIVPPSPESIIITYLSLVLLFVMLGDQIDRFHGSNRPDAVANASAPT